MTRWHARVAAVWVGLVLTGAGAAGCAGADRHAEMVATILAGAAELARDAEARDSIVVSGVDGWLFFGPELRYVGLGRFWGEAAATSSRATRAEYADPLPAILDFHRQLEEIGVELLLVPVPPKSVIYPDRLSDTMAIEMTPPRRIDVAQQEFFDILRTRGVSVLDLTPPFLADRFRPGRALYCRQDTHWSGTGVVLAAERIVQSLDSPGWLEAVPVRTFAAEWVETEITGDLWRALDDPSLAKERLALRVVHPDPGARSASPGAGVESPIVLLGDSHTLVFHASGDMHAEGAGLADQLALELGFPMDVVGVRGSGATAARATLLRRARRTPDYWSRKRLVIWAFAAREFTEGDGWRLVPIR